MIQHVEELKAKFNLVLLREREGTGEVGVGASVLRE